MDYSLTWIQRCLNRTAEDREDGMLDMMLTPIISLTITFHCLNACMVFVVFFLKVHIFMPDDVEFRTA